MRDAHDFHFVVWFILFLVVVIVPFVPSGLISYFLLVKSSEPDLLAQPLIACDVELADDRS